MKNILRIWGKHLGVRDSLWFPNKRMCLFRRNRHATIVTHSHIQIRAHILSLHHHLYCHPNPHLLTLQYKSKTKDHSWLWGKGLEVSMFASSYVSSCLTGHWQAVKCLFSVSPWPVPLRPVYSQGKKYNDTYNFLKLMSYIWIHSAVSSNPL